MNRRTGPRGRPPGTRRASTGSVAERRTADESPVEAAVDDDPPIVPPPPDGTEYRLPVIDDLAGVVVQVGGAEPSYLRYSHGPDRDRDTPSMDYESGLPLPGLSVTVVDPPDWWARPASDWVARRICTYAELMDDRGGRRPWLLRGRAVSVGPDHEPLIVAAEPVAWVGDGAVREAVRRYRSRFDVGRDSRG